MSGAYVNESSKTFVAAANVFVGERLVLNGSGQVTQAAVGGAGAFSIGVAAEERLAGQDVLVWLWSAEGTVKCLASAAIVQGAIVYGSAAGRISSTAAGNAIGIATEAAAASGSLIEVAPIRG